MAYIGKKPEDKFRGLASYDTFTGDGSTTTFDTTNVLPDGGTYDVEVFVDNVRQEGGSGKSYTIGNDGNGDLKRITFAVAPDNGAEIYVINPGRNTAVVTVTDNSLTAAKLQTDAVTTAKIQDDAVTVAKIAPGAITTTEISPSAAIANSQLANSSITINGNAVSLGGSITAGTDWQSVTVADGSTTLNAVAGKGYFLDTNAGVIEVFLPTSPSRGDTVILADYSGTFGTNKVIVNTGGVLIDSTEGGPGSSNDFELTTNNQVVELVYVDAAKGWLVQTNSTPSGLTSVAGSDVYGASFITATGGTITTSGDYKIHTFTGDGCFVVSSLGGGSTPCAVASTVDYLVVAGGGGGASIGGGGGGAGGFRESSGTNTGCYSASPLGACVPGITVTASTYPITVGAGGVGGPIGPTEPENRGSNGSNSVFSTITSTGGGAGYQPGGCGSATTYTGGSGGGGNNDNQSGTAGSGNTPPTSPSQGNPGGNGITAPAGRRSGGGGGAGGAGETASNPKGGDGGVGVSTSISGSALSYSGGGGGGITFTPGGSPGGASPCGTGGAGGTGGSSPGADAGAGTINRGGGGGGASAPDTPGGVAGAGGKGIVIIRYKYQ